MSTLVVVLVLAAIIWFFGFWPFNQSYAYLPTYNDMRHKKNVPSVDNKPAP